MFDTGLPVLEEADGMKATFVEDDGIVVATSRQLHFLTLDGELERSVPFVLEGATHVEVHHIVVGDKGFGAVVFAVVDGEVKDRFCLVDPTAGLVTASCTDLDGGPVSPRFALTFDGARFAVFSPQDGAMHTWLFDTNGTLVEERDLWTGGQITAGLYHGVSRAGVDVLLMDAACDLVLHRVGTAGHTATSIVPPTLTVSGATNFLNWAAADGQASILALFNCRAVLGECAEVGYAPGALLSRVDLSTGEISATMVPMPLVGHVPLFIDGEKTGAVYTPGLYDMRFSRFTAEGAAEISEMRLPLSYLQTGIELQNLGATATLAPGDYVFVYEGTGVGVGRRRNVARIQVP